MCVAYSSELCFVGLSTKEIIVFDNKQWDVVTSITTGQAPTSMDVIQDRILVYGIGDEGYGCIFFNEDFRKYERSSGTERGTKAVAKVTLATNFNEDGFVWKLGGYHAITGGYVTTKLNGKKKLPTTLCSFKFCEKDGMLDTFKKLATLQRNVTIIGEIEEDNYLCYSHDDHSFAKWNASHNRFRTVNLIRQDEIDNIDGIPKPFSQMKSLFE